MLDLLYVLVVLITLPFWFLMIFLPKREITRRVSSSYLVFLVLGVLYIFTLVGAVMAVVDSASKGGPRLDFSNIQALAGIFSVPAASLVAWVHMITLDLLAGHWLYHEAERLKAPRVFSSLTLILTFLFAPLGIFVFVLWRSLIAMRGHTAAQQHAPTA
jgi:hypothetical protein